MKNDGIPVSELLAPEKRESSFLVFLARGAGRRSLGEGDYAGAPPSAHDAGSGLAGVERLERVQDDDERVRERGRCPCHDEGAQCVRRR